MLLQHHNSFIGVCIFLMGVVVCMWSYEMLRFNGNLIRTRIFSYKSQIGSNILVSLPDVHVKETNCTQLFNNDSAALSQAVLYQEANPHQPISDDAFTVFASNCTLFRDEHRYIMQPLSGEEESFPIAYSILMYRDVEQMERLLRAIYQPQNYYCIHVDQKSTQAVKQAIEAIAGCFENVFLASRMIEVYWGDFSVLEPELVCMEDLWKHKKWKYFINLTGQEFPLKTNQQLVKILQVYNGTNDVNGTINRRNIERTMFIHEEGYQSDQLKGQRPVEVTLTKGPVHGIFSRGFVDFVLHDERVLQFREWLRDTGFPDETFFSSLNHSPQLGVPGAIIGEPDSYRSLARYKIWGGSPCAGKFFSDICIFGVGDLHQLQKQPELFANKFYADFEPLAFSCMEEWHFSKIREEIQGKSNFNVSFYESLSFLRQQI